MLAANLFMIVFRLLHIVAGVLWVGSAFLFVGFIGPSAAEVGPAAGPILHAAVKKRKVPKVITGLGITTVVGRNVERLVDMSDTVAASGGPPTPEQQARIEHLGGEIEKHGKIDLVLLLLAVACMATARYW